jgi:photosystem II stability/assembly factor-like uncharacterized protein
MRPRRNLWTTLVTASTLLMASTGSIERIAASEARCATDVDDADAESFWRPPLSADEYMRAVEAMIKSQPPESAASRLTGWRPIGPTGDPMETAQLPAPFHANNGRIRDIEIRNEAGGYVVYVGAAGGGIWRTSGPGPVWTSLGDKLPHPSVGAFAVHPNNPSDILVGTGDYVRIPGAGLFHTTDAGQSWTQIPLSPTPTAFDQILYLPGNPNVVLAASDKGLWRSTNGPAGPWTVRLTGRITDLVIHPTDPNTQYACRATDVPGTGGLWVSSNAGQTWTQNTATGVPASNIGNARLAQCHDYPNDLLYVYEWGGVVAGVRKSVDGGAHWTDFGTSPPVMAGEAWHSLSVAFRPDVPTEIYVGANELYRSTDGGIFWFALHDVERHQDQTQLVFSPVTGNDVLWICNDGGVYRYVVTGTSSESWNGDSTSGLRVAQFYDMDAKRNVRVGGEQDDGTVCSLDGGATWSVYACCDAVGTVITDDLNPTFWYSHNGPVVRQVAGGAAQDVSYSESLYWLFYDRLREWVYGVASVGTETRVLGHPADGTGAWVDEGNNVPSGMGRLSGSVITGQTLYAWGGSILLVLQRSGDQWDVDRSVALPNTVFYVYPSIESPGECWAGLEGAAGSTKLLHTTDDWANWTDITGTLSSVGAVMSIAGHPFDHNTLYVGTDVGVFRTQDGGAAWETFQTDLPIVRCMALKYVVDGTYTGNDRLIVATFGHGMYERTIARPGTAYVDRRNLEYQDGTYDHAFDTFQEGYDTTPDQGVLGVFEGTYVVPSTLSRPMTIYAYGGPVQLDQ